MAFEQVLVLVPLARSFSVTVKQIDEIARCEGKGTKAAIAHTCHGGSACTACLGHLAMLKLSKKNFRVSIGQLGLVVQGHKLANISSARKTFIQTAKIACWLYKRYRPACGVSLISVVTPASKICPLQEDVRPPEGTVPVQKAMPDMQNTENVHCPLQ